MLLILQSQAAENRQSLDEAIRLLNEAAVLLDKRISDSGLKIEVSSN